MARRSTPSPPPPPPPRSPAERRNAIERLRSRIAELQAFDPLSVQGRRSTEVVRHEAAIEETLTAIFGRNTHRHHLYGAAADLEPAAVLSITPSWIAARGGGMQNRENPRELQTQISEWRKQAIVLLEQAIQGLEEEFIPELPPSAPEQPTPIPVESISEAALEEIRKAIIEIKSQLPTVTATNVVKAEIESDIVQITTEVERPTPRRKTIKVFLESLRDNLAKAAGAGVPALIAAVGAILAKHFNLF